jgi:hypothetical protein
LPDLGNSTNKLRIGCSLWVCSVISRESYLNRQSQPGPERGMGGVGLELGRLC